MSKRQPNEKTTHFEVATADGSKFRRAGIEFSPQPQIVERAKLSKEQTVELMNTPVLRVEELEADDKRLKPKKADDKK